MGVMEGVGEGVTPRDTEAVPDLLPEGEEVEEGQLDWEEDGYRELEGVTLGEAPGVKADVGVRVPVRLGVGEPVRVGVRVPVGVTVEVWEGEAPPEMLGVGVAVMELVGVPVAEVVGELVGVCEGVRELEGVLEMLDPRLRVVVGVREGVGVAVGEKEMERGVRLPVGVLVGESLGVLELEGLTEGVGEVDTVEVRDAEGLLVLVPVAEELPVGVALKPLTAVLTPA